MSRAFPVIPRRKKIDITNVKIKPNPRYDHIKPKVDSGPNISNTKNQAQKAAIMRGWSRELFHRLRLTSFVKLVLVLDKQATEKESKNESDQSIVSPPPIQSIPSSLTVLVGIGEKDSQRTLEILHPEILSANLRRLPYLIIDVREAEDFQKSHIITALNIPASEMSRNSNYEPKEMRLFKNSDEHIIIFYGQLEGNAAVIATTFVERGYNNIFLLTGGYEHAIQTFPYGLLTDSCTPGKDSFAELDVVFLRHTMEKFDEKKNSIIRPAKSLKHHPSPTPPWR